MHAINASAIDDVDVDVAKGFDFRQLHRLRFDLNLVGDAQRAQVEAYIGQRFAGRHGARIQHFLPNLLSLNAGAQSFAAVGLAAASTGSLFAEQYLTAPIDVLIAQSRAQPVGRDQILEIGNLVSSWKGSSLLLFVFLSELVYRLGHRYVVFTATREVERLLQRLDYSPTVLANADPRRLADTGASWGSYYAHGPRVMYGEVRPAVEAVRKRILYRVVAHALRAQVERVCAEWSARNGAGKAQS